MIGRALRLTRSPFIRSVALLSGGNAFAMVLPILAAPILGRLYNPADYGALATYMAPMAILAILATLQFQYAIVAERTQRVAGMVAWLSIGIAPIVGGLTALGVLLLWPGVLSKSAPGAWFFMLPVMVSIGGMTGAGNFLANRHRRYRWLATLQITSISISLATSMSLGFLGFGKHGLILAYVVGQAVQILANGWLLFFSEIALPRPSRARLVALARRHWRFPAYSLPAEAANQLSQSLPTYALSSLGAYGVLGAFARANQLVAMPVTIVGQSIANVFRQKGSEMYNSTGNCRSLMWRVALGVFAITLPVVAFVMIFGPWLFTVYLGPAWTEAGELARVLAPMLLLRNVSAPLANVFLFAGKQATAFRLLFGLLVALVASFGLVMLAVPVPEIALVYTFSVMFGLYYIVEFLFALKAGGP